MWFGLLAAAALALTPAQVRNPRPGGWVTDAANVIDDADEAAMNRRIDAMNASLDVEIAVVTVASVDEGTPKQFTTELFNLWGVGDAQTNNGLVILLAVEQRRLEMETGYGLEGPLPDGWLGVMQSQRMVPLFKKGDFGGGLEAGLIAVDSRLRGDHPPPISGGARPDQPQLSASDARFYTLVIVGGVGLFILVAVGIVFNWRRRRTCPDCRIPMVALSEADEDEHLSPGQEREERIGSRSWDVYQCPECEFTRTFGSAHLFSGYSRCPSCSHRTRSTSRQTLQHPSTYSSGSARVTETCAHCSYHNSYTVTLPPLGDSSSSSSSSSSFGGGGGFSSGGGGFGGGSSGGGGAGSSW